MRILHVVVALVSVPLAACGSEEPKGGHGSDPYGDSFEPPPLPGGYERLVAPVIEGIEPGTEVNYCQYVRAPSDRDLDVLDLDAYQSAGGHHVAAYGTTVEAPLGYSGPCRDQDRLPGSYIGGAAGTEGGAPALPPGVVFRLPRGSAIMLNSHFLNTTDRTLNGEVVVDVRLEDADPARTVASLFVNTDVAFTIPAGSEHQLDLDCPVARDMDFIMFTNHMHEFGTSARTDLIRQGSTAPELVHEDPVWREELTWNSDFEHYSQDSPLRVHAGDTLHTECRWTNTKSEDLAFPREMCVGLGFFLSTGLTSPACNGGVWTELATSSAP